MFLYFLFCFIFVLNLVYKKKKKINNKVTVTFRCLKMLLLSIRIHYGHFEHFFIYFFGFSFVMKNFQRFGCSKWKKKIKFNLIKNIYFLSIQFYRISPFNLPGQKKCQCIKKRVRKIRNENIKKKTKMKKPFLFRTWIPFHTGKWTFFVLDIIISVWLCFFFSICYFLYSIYKSGAWCVPFGARTQYTKQKKRNGKNRECYIVFRIQQRKKWKKN